jgi:phosphotransferase system HPr-like phosphotransfer protein
MQLALLVQHCTFDAISQWETKTMAKTVDDAQTETVMLFGLARGLTLLLNEGEHAKEAVFPLAQVIEERLSQLADDLDLMGGVQQ